MSVCDAPSLGLVESTRPEVYHLLTGTFNTIFFYLLAFNPVTWTLSIQHKVRGEGPHQFLALDRARQNVYATTWAKEPTLSAWKVVERGAQPIERINTVPITATGSYIYVTEDPALIYQAGGPTGEIHTIAANGGFGEKLQELLYVEPDELAKADKTRVALRYGSHGIDLSSKGQAFVPHLGHNSIFMYNVKEDGLLEFVTSAKSFGDGHDGPRHNVPSPDGERLYAITEHTSYVDVYRITPTSLEHKQRVSLLPSSAPIKSYRGDTLRFSQDGRFLYATTRGMTPATQGILAVWEVQKDGTLGGVLGRKPEDTVRLTTRGSGGKANAIESFPFHLPGQEVGTKENPDWIVLTDDDLGYVAIVRWDGETLEEVASADLTAYEKGEFTGASHAVWLS